jgi:WXG100 family type VII secretion target
MTGFEVTSTDLYLAQSFVTELAGDIAAELSAVSGEIASLLDSSWTGEAAGSFSAGWEEWREGAGDLLDALGRMGALLATTANAYDSQDASAQAQLRSAGQGL